jgi:hypothetical protein
VEEFELEFEEEASISSMKFFSFSVPRTGFLSADLMISSISSKTPFFINNSEAAKNK